MALNFDLIPSCAAGTGRRARTAPREVVLASKATMRATASPGSLDLEQHELAKRLELGPQAKSVQSPEFAARLAAAQHR
ncbi:conserved hypothetical protein [Mycobacterium tuberculosis T92]|nr:conserved hypothetical protein [Mycobacterium tuberculosis T92]